MAATNVYFHHLVICRQFFLLIAKSFCLKMSENTENFPKWCHLFYLSHEENKKSNVCESSFLTASTSLFQSVTSMVCCHFLCVQLPKTCRPNVWVHFYMRMWLWNTSTWIQHPAGDGLLWPPPVHHIHTRSHTHTHWGDAAGHRTEQCCFCSADTAGWSLVGCVRRHERTSLTLGSGVGLWSEREDQSAVRRVECDSRSALWVLCKITGLVLLRLCMWVSKGHCIVCLQSSQKNQQQPTTHLTLLCCCRRKGFFLNNFFFFF